MFTMADKFKQYFYIKFYVKLDKSVPETLKMFHQTFTKKIFYTEEIL